MTENKELPVVQSVKKVLITGVSGFLGHHLIKVCVEKGWNVTGVDKRPIPEGHEIPDHFIQADVKDLKFRDLMGITYVIHLAWRTSISDCIRHPEESTDDNIDMSIHLLEVCKEAGVKKFLFPSTASLYGNNPTPWTEDMRPDPIEPYSWQKLSIEYACQMYAKSYKLPTVIMKFFQVFGELQREDTAISVFSRLKQSGRPVTLTKTAEGSEYKSGQRDFIYAGDLAEACVMALESDKTGQGEIFNVATGRVHTMEEIAEAMGAEIIFIDKRNFDVDRHHGDITKIQKTLGWGNNLVDVVEWLKENEN